MFRATASQTRWCDYRCAPSDYGSENARRDGQKSAAGVSCVLTVPRAGAHRAGARRPWIIGGALLLAALAGTWEGLWLRAVGKLSAAGAHGNGATHRERRRCLGTGCDRRYVTADREATVSAQITGTVTALLMPKRATSSSRGKVLARLDDTAQEGESALAGPGAAAFRTGAAAAGSSRCCRSTQRDVNRDEDLIGATSSRSRRWSRPAHPGRYRARAAAVAAQAD